MATRLSLLHFSDVHGRLDQLPRLFTLISRQRAAALAEGRRVLILDGGDSSDRQAWESDVTQGRANFALLEAMGVQASVAGDGEALEWGRPALARLVAGAHFPVLAANLVDQADPGQPAVPGLQPACLFDLDGLRVGLIGATAGFGPGRPRFGCDAVDPLPAVRREIGALRAAGAQLIVLLSHLGCPPPDTWAAQSPARAVDDLALAAACPEIAVIVGGHSHLEFRPPARVGRTLIVQAGAYGRWLGRLDLEIDDAGAVIGHRGELLACDSSVPPDGTLAATLDLVREEAGRLLDTPVGAAAQEYPHRLDAPSPAAGLAAEALRQVCGAELAILSSTCARRGLPAGPLRRRDLYEAFPGGARAAAAQVSGAQIRRLLNRMLAARLRTQPPGLGLPAGSANVELRFDLGRPAGDQVVECRVDGAALEPERRYRLASTTDTLREAPADSQDDLLGLEAGQRVEWVRAENVLWEIVEAGLRGRSPAQNQPPPAVEAP